MDALNFKVKKTRIFTKEQELADRIFFYFGKEITFPTIMRFIKTKGYQAIYEIWNEVKHSKPKNKLSLFLWKVKNERIVYCKKNGKQNSKNNHNRK